MPWHLGHTWRRSPQERELERLITTGFKRFGYSRAQERAAAEDWLAAWNLFTAMLTPDIRAVPAFYHAHPKVRIDLEHWLMHLDMDQRAHLRRNIRFCITSYQTIVCTAI